MSQIKNKTIWLTGASSGIGLALLALLVAQGNRVIVSARREKRLQALRDQYGERVIPLVLDVTDPASLKAARELLSTIVTPLGGLDVAIINAGDCKYLDGGRCDSEIIKQMTRVNFFGAVDCAEIAEPYLKVSPSGGAAEQRKQLVFVSSLATRLAFPRAGAYGASKAALDYLAASLRIDWASSCCDVTLVSPGFVATPLTASNDFSMPFIMSPQRAARAIVRGMERGKASIAFPLALRALLRVLAMLPHSWQAHLLTRDARRREARR